jgi:membrane associated rhomboid family serine protease
MTAGGDDWNDPRPGCSFGRSGAVMGIYDREYYRGETSGSAWFSGIAPVCKWLIGINVGVFLVDYFHMDHGFLEEHMMASPEGTLRHLQLWQLLTATFMHAGPWHVLGNMLFLWIVGREMESLYGSKDFLAFYLVAAVVSTLVWALTSDLAGNRMTPMVGASGAVLAVVTLYTLYYPKREIALFFIPMPMWVVLALYLFVPFFTQNGERGGSHIAIQSHLAGAGFAVLFKHFDLRWSRLVSGRRFRPRLKIFTPAPYEQPGRTTRTSGSSWTTTSAASSNKPAAASVIPEEQLDAQLDEVLAKIAREGRNGLTDEEQRVLQEASRRARIKRSDRP